MDVSTYVDLFATKGIEYLLVIGFLAALVFYWRFLNGSAEDELAPSVAGMPAMSNPWFYLPENVLCHQGHGWVAPEEHDVVTVGIDDFAQRLLGRARAIALPGIGADLQQGNQGWELEIDGHSIGMLSPIDGEVLAVNEELLGSPQLINEDPYGKGWLMKVRVPRLRANLTNLLSGRLAAAWMDETVAALQRRMSAGPGVVLQDGGMPVVGFARVLSEENWEELAGEFLKTS